MCTQQHVVLEIQRVVRVHRRMIGREIQRAKVVPLRLDEGAERDGETELAEDVHDLFDHERHRMFRPVPHVARGHRQIERVATGRPTARQFTSARLVRTGDLRLDLVEYATGDGFVFIRKRAKRLLNGLQLSAAITDELDARCLELFGRLSALERRKCFYAELLGVQLKLLYRCHGSGGAYPTDPFLPTDPRNETRSGGSARNLAPPPRPFNESNDALCGVECRACFFGERGKRRRIMHGEIGENLPVDLDAGFAEPVHELAVAQIVQVRARVDAGDPETAEVPLFVLAVAVRVFPTALHVLLRRLPQLAAAAKRSAGRLHDLLLPLETRNVRSSAR